MATPVQWSGPPPEDGPAPGVEWASPGARLVGYIVDGLIQFGLSIALFFAAAVLAVVFWPLAVIAGIAGALFLFLYFPYFWQRDGQTPGMKLMQIDQLDEAIVELQQARKDQRLLWKAAMNLGICFKKRNNWRLAQRNLEEALAALPEGDDAGRKELLYHLATGFADAGELQKAIDLGHDLANIDFGYRDIGKLIDGWEKRLNED